MNDKKIIFGIIGIGYWGQNYIRILKELGNTELKWCADLDDNNLKKIKLHYPDIKTTKNYKDILKDDSVKAVVIVTPANTHHKVIKDCLDSDKNVLVEKPFVTDIEAGEKLVELARNKELKLMVGHVYIFHPAIKKINELINKNKLGNVYYIKSDRIGLGPIRKSGSALWDLAVHDIYIITHLLGKKPENIFAYGGDYLQKGVEDFVSVNLKFKNKVFASINASWFAPEKIRRMTIVGSKGMVVFDDTDKQSPLKFFVREINTNPLNVTPEYHDHQNILTIGEMYKIPIAMKEPLKEQVLHFVDCITKNSKLSADVDGRSGQEIVKMLKYAEMKLKM